MPASRNSPNFALSLADGTSMGICAVDAESARVVSFLAGAARLQGTPGLNSPSVRHKLVVTDASDDGTVPPGRLTRADPRSICVLGPRELSFPRQWRPCWPCPAGDGGDSPALNVQPLTDNQWLWQQLVRLSACIGRETHARGGVLLHSGLAAYPDSRLLLQARGEGGVLLAGRSGVGKSTATRRLPSPWRTLADDVTLVVRDAEGTYWAHPWPTWSRFFGEEAGDGGDTWDVQQSVPLRAIFVLEQGEEDRVEPMGPGHAVCLLAELALQTSTHVLEGMLLDEVVAFNLQRFENLCDLVQAVPAYLLDVSLDGAFWGEIERVMQS